ncbi:MAG: TldD/PmbA family protein [Lachnospiraceae bacterium]|jgi:PmbA protein|nr:TldD/PmbA family protein [Lachnospiraceae bacterium]
MENIRVMDRYREACLALPEEIKRAGAEGRREKILSLSVTGGALAGSRSCDVTTVSVSAAGDDGRWGYAFTQNLEEEPREVFRRAAEAGKLAGDTVAERAFGQDGGASSVVERAESVLHAEDLLHTGIMVEKWALESHEAVTEATVTVSSFETDNWVVNSEGLSRSAAHTWLDVEVDVVVVREGRKGNLSWYASLSGPDDLEGRKEDLERSLRRNLTARQTPVAFTSGVYRVLLSRESIDMILVTLWQAFSGCHQREQSSFLTDRMGQRIASKAFSMVDAPEMPGCGYGRRLDCQGIWARETALVTDGVMTGRIHNLASAAYFGEEPTGNAGRAEGFFSGLPTGMTAIPNVTCILPGEMKEEEMLSRLGDGVWITETYDPFHSIEIGSGEFAIPCNGVRVIGGKPVGALNSLTITGNLAKLLPEIEAAGDTVAFRRFYTGLYYLGGPELLIRRLQVNG